MLIEALPWDTGFFGITTGAVRSGTFDAKAFEAERDAFELVYIFEHAGDDRNRIIETYCGTPADTRITYKKILQADPEWPAGIVSFAGSVPDEQLLSMAIQSGIYSRFHTDKRFPADAFVRLYTTWIERSADRSLACEVLVFREQDAPAQGFITLEVKDGEIRIGLVAVDEAARGKGIGTKLVRAAEAYARQRNFLYLKVATQAANREACRLYEKCGFAVDESLHIYHYWKA